MRIERDTERGHPVILTVDGKNLTAFEGEMLATAMLQHDAAFRRDTRGLERGLFCNMGSCSECMVTLLPSGRRARACLTPVSDGLEVRTDG